MALPCPNVSQPAGSDHPPQLWPDDAEAQLTLTPCADPPKALNEPEPSGTEPCPAPRPICTDTRLAPPPSLPHHSCMAVPPDALHGVPCLAHAASHVVDATGRLPSLHSCFLLPVSLMASRAAQSTSPDGCCSDTFCYECHRISSLTE